MEIFEEKINSFAKQMIARMEDNKHKGGWSEREFSDIVASMGNKFVAVLKAVADKDIRLAAESSVHLANHCMMMTDRLGYIERNTKE